MQQHAQQKDGEGGRRAGTAGLGWEKRAGNEGGRKKMRALVSKKQRRQTGWVEIRAADTERFGIS
jgi:hypothetical protein